MTGPRPQDYDPVTMGVGTAARMISMVAVTAILGCNGTNVFLCQDNSECADPGGAGTCQPTGYCSFPDDQCPSGERYGDHAGGSLANTCVDPADVVTSSGTIGGPSGGSDPTLDGGVTTTPPPTDSDGTTVSLDDGPQSSTNPDGAEDTGTTTGDPSTTTGAGLVCVLDEFDDDQLHERWCETNLPWVEISEQSGQLWFELNPPLWGGGFTSDVHNCDPFPLQDASVTVEVEQVPAVSPTTEAYLELGNDTERLGMGVINGQFQLFIFNGMDYAVVNSQAHAPKAQRFWRIRGTDEELIAEYSPDGRAWALGHSRTADTSLDGLLRLGVWSDEVPLGFDEAIFESIELCSGS